MSSIEEELLASIRLDALNGNARERAVCANQMARAAAEIKRLRVCLQSEHERHRELLQTIIHGFTEDVPVEEVGFAVQRARESLEERYEKAKWPDGVRPEWDKEAEIGCLHNQIYAMKADLQRLRKALTTCVDLLPPEISRTPQMRKDQVDAAREQAREALEE